MTATTKLPTRSTGLTFFQWSRPDAARPALARDLASSDTTVYFNYAPKNADGTTVTQPFLMIVKRLDGTDRGFRMQIYCPNGADGPSGLSATAIVQGIAFNGLDYTTSDSDYLLADGFKDGDPIECAISPTVEHLVFGAIQGEIGTGGNAIRIGDLTSGDKYIYAQNADASKPFIRYNDTTNAWELSNDGTSTSSIGSGSSVTGGDGITVTSGDIDIDLTDTVVFVQTSSGAGDAGKVPRLSAGTGKLATGFITAAPFTTYISDSAALVGGATSNADALHTHEGLGVYSFPAYEALTANDAVCLLPIEVKHYTQLVEVDIALGDSNARRRYAVKFVPNSPQSFTTMVIRGKKVASSTLNLLTSIQTDNAGAPSGTPVTNGTANSIATSGWTTSYADRTITWASAPSLSSGTVYWLVFEVDATDGTNFIRLGTNASYDENYHTFTRLTYNLDTTSWGGSVTDSTPFFSTSSTANALGFALARCHATYGYRTWNFIGFVTSSASAQDTATVYTQNVTLSGLTQNADYYLSTSYGQVTTTVPDNGTASKTASVYQYKIGKALSSTAFKVETGMKRVFLGDTWTSADDDQVQLFITWFRPTYVEMKGIGADAPIPDRSNGTAIATSASFQIAFGQINDAAWSSNPTSIYTDAGGTESDPIAVISAMNDIGFTVTTSQMSTFTTTLIPYFLIEG